MSEEGSFGITMVEKAFGLLLLGIGAVICYFTVTSAIALKDFTGFFAVLSLILVIIGLVMMLAKTE